MAVRSSTAACFITAAPLTIAISDTTGVTAGWNDEDVISSALSQDLFISLFTILLRLMRL
jgi:hypothetical protein